MSRLSKVRVSVMAAELDEMVVGAPVPADGHRVRYALVWIDALTENVQEGMQTVNLHASVATSVLRPASGRQI